jgi:hypothetical protein
VNDAMPKRDDLTLLSRRLALTDSHRVAFTHYRPEVPDGAPAYPLRWVASWTDAKGKEQQAGPMAMTELIPAVEDALGITGRSDGTGGTRVGGLGHASR